MVSPQYMDVESRKKIKEQKFVNLRYNRIRNTTAFLVDSQKSYTEA